MKTPETKQEADRHFVSVSGQFYVAHWLTRHRFHAAITLGNAPNVDIIVADASGSAALSIQVKTATDACAKRHFGKEAGEWRVSRSAFTLHHQRLWYALVDMPKDDSKPPVVYIVPSSWIAGFLELQMIDPEIRSKYLVTRKDAWYYLVKELWDDCKDRWDRIRDFLRDDTGVIQWCSSCPVEGRDWKDERRWGKCTR
jgi:hypothetical protein